MPSTPFDLPSLNFSFHSYFLLSFTSPTLVSISFLKFPFPSLLLLLIFNLILFLSFPLTYPSPNLDCIILPGLFEFCLILHQPALALVYFLSQPEFSLFPLYSSSLEFLTSLANSALKR